MYDIDIIIKNRTTGVTVAQCVLLALSARGIGPLILAAGQDVIDGKVTLEEEDGVSDISWSGEIVVMVRGD